MQLLKQLTLLLLVHAAWGWQPQFSPSSKSSVSVRRGSRTAGSFDLAQPPSFQQQAWTRRSLAKLSFTSLQASNLFPDDLSVGDVVDAGSAATASDGGGIDMASIQIGTTVFLVAAYVAAKIFIYWRMQYIYASFLGNRMPRVEGGADVLYMGATDGKSLYYLPPCRRVIMSAVGQVDQGLMDQTAEKTAIRAISVRPQRNDCLDCRDELMDAVYSIRGFRGNAKKLIREVGRVLKPGGMFLFIEKGRTESLVAELERKIGPCEVNVVENFGIEPYTVGICSKSTDAPDNPNRKVKRELKKRGNLLEE